jgi:hypothetical protein
MTFSQNVANLNAQNRAAHRLLENQPAAPLALYPQPQPRLSEILKLQELLTHAIGRRKYIRFCFQMRSDWTRKCRADGVDDGLAPSEEFVITHLEAALRTEHMKAAAEIARMTLDFGDEPGELVDEETDLRNSLAYPV